ncbi:MAG: lysozyme [Candidatus Puniceispirillaceae bacterium]
MSFRTKALGVGAAGILGVVAIAGPFVAGWEGLRTDAYLDPVGIPTICYGHTRGVEIGHRATREHCEQLLAGELIEYAEAVHERVMVPMPDTRFAALTSFAYNVGIGNFERSTMLRLLNDGRTREACNELTRWVFAKGRILRGLQRRRHAEKELCLQGLPEET